MSAAGHARSFAPSAAGPRELVGLSRAELSDLVAGLGEPRFRARQLWQWMYHRGCVDFSAMSNLSKALRQRLGEGYTVGRPEVAREQTSADGTVKWLLRLADGNEVEAVFIPEADRGTICLSSQVGCTLTCRFCHTGTQRLVRNLSAAEIVGQVLLARDRLGEWPTAKQSRRLTNVVFMGMGEPLYNYNNVAKAAAVLLDGEGLGFSRRRVTLSTSGVVPMMRRCGEELGVNLAVSLHAVRDELRDRLVPLNRKYPLAELIAACRSYPGVHNVRRITFEYVMLKGVNDGEADARALARLVAGIPAKVNLIPFNPWPGSGFECSEPETIARFAAVLGEAGLAAPVRPPRGQDVMAACGQLKSASERRKKSERKPAHAPAVAD